MELTPEQQALANSLHVSGAFEPTPPEDQTPFLILFRPGFDKEGWREPLYNSAVRALQAIPGLFAEVNRVIGVSTEGEELAEKIADKRAELSLLTFQLDPAKESLELRGDYQPGDKVVAVDTYLYNQFKVREHQRRLASYGLELTRVGLVLGHRAGVIEKLRDSGIETTVALTITDMLKYYLSGNRFHQDVRERITAYLEARQKATLIPQLP